MAVALGPTAWSRLAPGAPQPATWWIVAAVGVELIHSLIEFPMWSAHFLGVAALLMGTVAGVSRPDAACARAGAVLRRSFAAAVCASLAALWLRMGAPLDRDELDLELRWSARVMRYLPSNAIVGRRAVFLALDGRADEAAALIDRLASHAPASRMKTVRLLQRTRGPDAVIARLVDRLGVERRNLIK